MVQIPLPILLSWAEKKPQVRFPALAAAVHLWVGPDTGEAVKLSPLALGLIDAAPDKKAVLERLGKSLHSFGWSGSLVANLEKRRKALEPLKNHSDSVVRAWALQLDASLAREAEDERRNGQAKLGGFE